MLEQATLIKAFVSFTQAKFWEFLSSPNESGLVLPEREVQARQVLIH